MAATAPRKRTYLATALGITDAAVKDVVRQKYGQAALRVATGETSCCGSTTSQSGCDPATSNLYGTGLAFFPDGTVCTVSFASVSDYTKGL